MLLPKIFKAAQLADQTQALGYDQRQFINIPNIVCIAFIGVDGHEAILRSDTDATLCTARNKLFQKLNRKVERHLKWEQKRLKRKMWSL